MEPVKAPWIRPGVVVHDPSVDVDDLLARFALTLKQRGFRISGFVQVNNRQIHDGDEGCADPIELLDLDSGETVNAKRHPNPADDRTAVQAAALIAPATPMSPRLHSYGIEILGGLRVPDVESLARAVGSGGQPRNFERFGEFAYVGVGTSNRAENGSAAVSLLTPPQPKTAGTAEHRNALLARR